MKDIFKDYPITKTSPSGDITKPLIKLEVYKYPNSSETYKGHPAAQPTNRFIMVCPDGCDESLFNQWKESFKDINYDEDTEDSDHDEYLAMLAYIALFVDGMEVKPKDRTRTTIVICCDINKWPNHFTLNRFPDIEDFKYWVL